MQGILQGNISGPLILIIYTNDKLQNLPFDQVFAYVDELPIFYCDISESAIVKKWQELLDRIGEQIAIDWL